MDSCWQLLLKDSQHSTGHGIKWDGQFRIGQWDFSSIAVWILLQVDMSAVHNAEPTALRNHLIGLSKDLSQMLQMKNSFLMTTRLGNDSTAPTNSLEHDLFFTLLLLHELRPHITDFGWRLFNILAAIVNKTQHTHIEIAKCRYSVSNGTQTTRHLRPRGEDCTVDCFLEHLCETQTNSRVAAISAATQVRELPPVRPCHVRSQKLPFSLSSHDDKIRGARIPLTTCSALYRWSCTPLIADTQAGIHYLQQARFERCCNREDPPMFGLETPAQRLFRVLRRNARKGLFECLFCHFISWLVDQISRDQPCETNCDPGEMHVVKRAAGAPCWAWKCKFG